MSRQTTQHRAAAPNRPTPPADTRPGLLPLGALAAGFGLAMTPLHAQTTTPVAPAATASAPASAVEATLPVIKVKAAAEATDKDSYRATKTTIGKGNQELRDVPQSVTVVTERLIDDRNLNTLKEVLHNTAGVTFMAAEGGEEDIRLRGFSLAATGDIFVDGLRDPAFYDRDTFSYDRVELLRGSASMLFGRGSTGGVVNQVNKQPQLVNQNELSLTAGTGNFIRNTGDFNVRTGENSAVRINAMLNQADNSGNKIDKHGIAPSFRWGIDTSDEFSVGLYYLETKNGINYGLPWLQGGLINIDPKNYYSAASDYNASSATHGTVSHIHRFGDGGELKSAVRHGSYTRDQRAGTIRFRPLNALPNSCQTPITNTATGARAPSILPTASQINDNTQLCRGTNNKVQDMDTTYAQSDYSNKYDWFRLRNDVLTGIDLAHEKFNNYNVGNLPPGVTLDKNTPFTTIGTPNDGLWVDESLRIKRKAADFDAKAVGVYFQDLVQVAPSWKILGGLRWDYFHGNYRSYATAATTTAPVVVVGQQTADRSRTDSLWSKRVGLLYQPTQRASFHFSYGTSFNTSGDTYQYDNQTENTDPESSGNLEVGAKVDSADGRFTSRVAVFRATKYNERNRDPDSAATQNLLSGKRHAAGVELDLSGKLTSQWEVFGSYAWTPIAKIDVGAPGSVPGVGEGAGTRSALTPRHSGTIWSTYQFTRSVRAGGGLNARSSQTPNRNPVGIVAPSFVTADLMAEYSLEDIAFKLNVTNVTNKLYADALYTGHYIPGAGRSVQLTMGVKF